MTAPKHDDVQAWARGAVSASPNATQAELRVAALRFVSLANFAPPLDDALAVGVVLGRPRDPVEAFTSQVDVSREEAELGQAIERLTRDFFRVSTIERRQRWTTLYSRAILYPWWRSRLDPMRSSLDLELTGQLYEIESAELFALPPGEREKRLSGYRMMVDAKTPELGQEVEALPTPGTIATLDEESKRKIKRSNHPRRLVDPLRRTSRWTSMRTVDREVVWYWLKLLAAISLFVGAIVVANTMPKTEVNEVRAFKAP